MVVAPGRRARPGAPAAARLAAPSREELDECPFCEGREARTPPESRALAAAPGRKPDAPGWLVRAIPNLYPALERQEVVVHSPRHVRSLAELADEELALVAAMWEDRIAAAGAEGYPYVHAFVNEGRAAGASLAHSHSQLVWLREAPPAVAEEDAAPLGTVTAYAGLAVAGHGAWAVAAHPAGRAPYELLVVAREADAPLADGLVALRDAIARLRAAVGETAWNAWLHHGPPRHLHVLPRLAVEAGLELGAGIWINPVAPEEAAATLRGER